MVSYHSFQKIFRKSTPLCVQTRFSKKLLQTPVFKTLNPKHSFQKSFLHPVFKTLHPSTGFPKKLLEVYKEVTDPWCPNTVLKKVLQNHMTLNRISQKIFVNLLSTLCSIQKFFGSHWPMVFKHDSQKIFIFQHRPINHPCVKHKLPGLIIWRLICTW